MHVLGRIQRRLFALVRLIRNTMFSTLTRQIVILNLAGLVAMLLGFLYLNQFRAGLIDARIQSLITQGETLAGAIANTATFDVNTTYIDPNRIWELESGETIDLSEDFKSSLEFSINPEKIAQILKRLVVPTKTRARVYDRDGYLLIDSLALYSFGDVLKYDLPPPNENQGVVYSLGRWYRGLFRSNTTTAQEVAPAIGKNLPEVQIALRGERKNAVHITNRGDTIVSVAVPIQRLKTVSGVLLLSTQSGDIDGIIAAERIAMLRFFLVAASITIILSFYLARSIVIPVNRLSRAADKVRNGTKEINVIPDFSNRSDEIGHLSGSLRDMTLALFNRIEAIERFAADVAHELKNPLTSVRSAVETMPLAKTDEARIRLFTVIKDDVKRMDRLITDISDASRLDAELARTDTTPVNLAEMVSATAQVMNDRLGDDADHRIELQIEQCKKAQDQKNAFIVEGHASRLGQVLNNLLDNALSFSPPGKPVLVSLSRKKEWVELIVDDFGPGIPQHAFEKIFERFYTDRPEQGFGQNSGLGLAISRQIVLVHRGTIHAENRYANPEHDEEEKPLGTRFVVRLPVKEKTKNKK